EPLISKVPVIAANVGGIPELIINNVTGKLIENDRPQELIEAVNWMRQHPSEAKAMTERGHQLAKTMFDSRRTSNEIVAIYQFLLGKIPKPQDFSPTEYVQQNLSHP